MQVFDHVEGERATLVRLLVEEAERRDLFLVLLQVAGKGLDDGVRLRFRLGAEAAEGDLVEVDVVDDLLAFAAGVFNLVAQGGLQRVWQVFGTELDGLMDEMNRELVA